MATAVKRPTGRQEVTDAVLDAAEALFAASGPADVSLRAIARQAGVNYGLVHRHFGTKDDVFDRLLQRYAERWLAQLDTVPDYSAALDRLLGPRVDAGAYLRLLAWTLLSDRQEGQAQAPGRRALLDQLVALEQAPTGPEATATTAGALALIFGWRFFNPFIRAALHVPEADAGQLHEAVRSLVQRLASARAPREGCEGRRAPGPPGAGGQAGGG